MTQIVHVYPFMVGTDLAPDVAVDPGNRFVMYGGTRKYLVVVGDADVKYAGHTTSIQPDETPRDAARQLIDKHNPPKYVHMSEGDEGSIDYVVTDSLEGDHDVCVEMRANETVEQWVEWYQSMIDDEVDDEVDDDPTPNVHVSLSISGPAYEFIGSLRRLGGYGG